MKKSDLKPFMAVRLRNGEMRLVISVCEGEIALIYPGSTAGTIREDYMNDDMTHLQDQSLDVVCVYKTPTLLSDFTSLSVKRRIEWEAPIPKEMTLAEIEAELGYSIKVVKEHG